MRRYYSDDPAEKYERLQMVGKGSFGQVYLVRNKKTAERAVMKCISLVGMGRQEKAETMREATMLQSLDHPNVIRYIESVESNNVLKIVTEYASRGDLHQILTARRGNRLKESLVLDWFLQICLGMKYLHAKHILHRDIKTSNIFLTDKGLIKIGDFGISKILAHTMQCAKTAVGTPYYMSPEICQSRPYNNRSDVWAMGCVLYELCTLKHAFEANSMKALVTEILRGRYKALPPEYSQDLRSLVASTLKKDPNERPSVAQILQLKCIKDRIQAFLQGRTSTNVDVEKKLVPKTRLPKVDPLPPIPHDHVGKPVAANADDAVIRAQQRVKRARRAARAEEVVGRVRVDSPPRRDNHFKRANGLPIKERLQPLKHAPVVRPAAVPKPVGVGRHLPPIAPVARENDDEDELPLVQSMKQALEVQPGEEAIFIEKDGAVGVQFNNGVDPLQKFQLHGSTFKLPNTSANDSLSQRVEVLRMHLEDLLGSAKLMQVHRILRTVNDEETGETAIKQAKEVMGSHKAPYLPLVMQLIFCEDVLNEEC